MDRIDERELSALLRAVAEGNTDAFEQLYHLTFSKLSAVTARMGYNEAEHADIMQQAYLTIWRKAHLFDPDHGKAFTWLLVVTRNKALDVLRRKARRGIQEPLHDAMPSPGAPSDLGARTALLRGLMRPHLSRLRPEVRDAVIRHVVHGATSRELGEHYGVSTNTAKSWVRRGLQCLRANIEASHEGSVELQDIL